MAGATCNASGCGNKAKKNNSLCDTCKQKVTDAQNGVQKEICDEILMYASFHRNTSAKDCIVAALNATCDADCLKVSKDLLYTEFGDLGLFEDYKNRVNSPNRTEKMALSDDVVTLLGVLGDNKIPVKFTAADWEKMPKVHPSKLADVALADQITELRGITQALQASIIGITSDVSVNTSKIKVLENDNTTHGKLIQQCYNKFDGGDKVDTTQWPKVGSNVPSSNASSSDTNSTNIDNQRRFRSVSASDANSTHDVAAFVRPRDHIRKEARRNRQQQSERSVSSTPSIVPPGGAKGRRTGIIGQANDTVLRGAPAPNRDIFIARVHKSDGLAEVEAHNKSKGVTPIDLSLACHAESKFNSFKLSVALGDVDKIMDPTMWPTGVRVRKWFSREASSESSSGRLSAATT